MSHNAQRDLMTTDLVFSQAAEELDFNRFH